MSKKKANGTLDGYFAKKPRGDDVDSCTTVAAAAAQIMECDGNSSSSSSTSSTATQAATTTQRQTEVTAISTDLNSADDLDAEEDTTSATTTALSTYSMSSSAPSSSSSPFDAHNIRDDQGAPRAVLEAAIALRIHIHENTEGGAGLIIHRFHIQRREDGEENEEEGNSKADDYAGWRVHCDVCDKPHRLIPATHTNPPLYNFQTLHLSRKGHLAKGQKILSSMDVAEVTK
jgi:hypothetical protein